ncbi:hypothetical protein [Nocardia asteroides]|uniref:hypothetical protein n=1 Tax=Nocardia asteroides TaxID=1824 RepID=UPI0002FF4AE9|nr:hypothetical protein [Nocardia asteroides]UGT51327.1 hypothetical protein LT345_12640 [Nocardia asteroides]
MGERHHELQIAYRDPILDQRVGCAKVRELGEFPDQPVDLGMHEPSVRSAPSGNPRPS